jgi:hypothetical protein
MDCNRFQQGQYGEVDRKTPVVSSQTQRPTQPLTGKWNYPLGTYIAS